MEKLIDVYMRHTPAEIITELSEYSAQNDGRGPALPQEVCRYLQGIGILKGYIENENIPNKTIVRFAQNPIKRFRNGDFVEVSQKMFELPEPYGSQHRAAYENKTFIVIGEQMELVPVTERGGYAPGELLKGCLYRTDHWYLMDMDGGSLPLTFDDDYLIFIK